MTVDYIFDFLTSLLDGLIGSDYLLLVAMLIPCLAIFGFITVYALVDLCRIKSIIFHSR